MELYDQQGQRLYFTADERAAFLKAAAGDNVPRQVRTFCGVLHHTGCRISEALALTPARVDLSGRQIIFRTLKKRGRTAFRHVPAPPELLDMLDMVHGLREHRNRKGRADELLWPWSRMTGWRHFKDVVAAAGIPDGPHASPKGLRHGFGINAITNGVPLNLLKKWLGHSHLSTTEIYANAVGQEERDIASRMWA